MLVITRKSGEGVWIGSAHVIVRVTDAGQVKVSIDAPATINIRRDELKERDDANAPR